MGIKNINAEVVHKNNLFLLKENEDLKKELEKRKGAPLVLQQIADKLKSLTGKQNVWQAIEKLVEENQQLRDELTKYKFWENTDEDNESS